jgi:hypothetical protein
MHPACSSATSSSDAFKLPGIVTIETPLPCPGENIIRNNL